MTDFVSQATLRVLQTGMHSALDRRRAKRTPLRYRATVRVAGQPDIHGSTLDASAGGLNVALPVSLPIGSECRVSFTIATDGKLISLTGIGKVVHSVCTSSQGFRVGMTFNVQEPQAKHALQKLVGHENEVTEQ
jgi:c-di-GMP-binding flagellar brake protein YcgR